MKLWICAVFRDEAAYLEEWIRFHLDQGFSRFLLFDDQSEDDFRSVLEPFVSRGIVTVRPACATGNRNRRQIDSYNVGLRMARGECDWLAFIDLDEFLFSPDGALTAALPRTRTTAGVIVWWRTFGTSGIQEPPDGGILSNFVRAARFPTSADEFEALYRLQNEQFFRGARRPISGRILQVKSIVRPSLVRRFVVHFPERYVGAMRDPTGRRIRSRRIRALIHGGRWSRSIAALNPTLDRIRINHYWTKSVAELHQKAAKFGRSGATIDDYLRWDGVLNEEEDRSILSLPRSSPRES